jgi:hypothetical protein
MVHVGRHVVGHVVRIVLPVVLLLGLAACADAPSDPPPVAPALAPIDDQRTTSGEPIDVAIRIDHDVPDEVSIRASSSDPTLVSDAGLDVLGSGPERVLRISPSPIGTGSVEIGVTALDADGLSDGTAFRLDVAAPFAGVPQKRAASDGADADDFGISVDLDGDDAIVGAWRHDLATSSEGAAYVFARDRGGWIQAAKLTASDAEEGDFFGFDVGIEAGTALVGAFGEDGAGSLRGAAYVFERDGDAWTQTAKLGAADAADGHRFGASVALDGDRALIGAWGAALGGTSRGAAYVFERDAAGWNQTARLVAADAADDKFFGRSVALQGDLAVVGASGDATDGPFRGAAYVFRRSGDAWIQTAKLTASDAADNDRFGSSLALEGDHVLVGAFWADLGETNEGAAYVFRRSGDAWIQTAKLTAPSPDAGDQFGHDVALDGDYALVSAIAAELGGSQRGAAHVFRRSGDAWIPTTRLSAPDGADFDQFGSAVALDGQRAAVAAYYADLTGTDQGAVYFFER